MSRILPRQGLAEKLGVAVGTINWHLKRLVEKGYVKVKRAERKKLHYIITPEGLTLRARLTVDYIQSSMELYRLVRKRSLKAIADVKAMGCTTISIEGEGDVAEILKLTSMEQGLNISQDREYPLLKVIGLKILLRKRKLKLMSKKISGNQNEYV